jgi:hypothetical protein
MTTATVSTTISAARSGRFTLLRAGLAVGAVAGVATSAFAAGVHSAGVPLEVSGEMIPLAGFAQLTVIFTLVGVGIGALCRRSSNARRLFTQITLGLTVLSLVPDAVADATTATKLALMTSHLIAATIVIPRLAGRLSD